MPFTKTLFIVRIVCALSIYSVNEFVWHYPWVIWRFWSKSDYIQRTLNVRRRFQSILMAVTGWCRRRRTGMTRRSSASTSSPLWCRFTPPGPMATWRVSKSKALVVSWTLRVTSRSHISSFLRKREELWAERSPSQKKSICLPLLFHRQNSLSKDRFSGLLRGFQVERNLWIDLDTFIT